MGWGPRGDSGPARGRVRASQPTIIPSFAGPDPLFEPFGIAVASILLGLRLRASHRSHLLGILTN